MAIDLDDDEPLLILPPSRSAGKGDAGIDEADEAEMLRRAEAAVEALKQEYPAWVEQHIANLEEVYRKARLSSDEERDNHLQTLARIAHDVKGEGTTYGYPLMTKLGGSLHRFVVNTRTRAKESDGDQIDIVEMYIGAMRVVIRDRIEGDGGSTGEALLRSLEEATVKLSD